MTKEEIQKMETEEKCLNLVIALITYARQNRKHDYRVTKKEIRRIQLEDKNAREFFKILKDI